MEWMGGEVGELVKDRTMRFQVFLGLLVPAALLAQAPDHLALGRAAFDARDPRAALTHFQAAMAEDSTSAEAAWRAAQAAVDIGKQTPDSVKSPTRDSLYALAERYARKAVTANPNDADGHFILSVAIGRASLTKGKRERVRRATEIRNEALKALELRPGHDGADHVLGRWNAEIMRLSGFERFFAKSFLGGRVFNQAAWDSAIVYMRRAVDQAPENIYHHLDLAEIYIDRKRYSEARQQLELIAPLPVVDVMDPNYKESAVGWLRRIEGKRDSH
jgi:tetratricopeptide (TPR) repeat protein